MKTSLFTILFVVILAGLVCAGTMQAPSTFTVTGKISALDASAGSLTIVDDDGKSMEFTTNEKTELFRDGIASTLDEFSVEEQVVVTHEKDSTVAKSLLFLSETETETEGESDDAMAEEIE